MENDSNGQIIVWTVAVCQRLLVVWLVVLTGCDAVDCSISGDNARQSGDNSQSIRLNAADTFMEFMILELIE